MSDSRARRGSDGSCLGIMYLHQRHQEGWETNDVFAWHAGLGMVPKACGDMDSESRAWGLCEVMFVVIHRVVRRRRCVSFFPTEESRYHLGAFVFLQQTSCNKNKRLSVGWSRLYSPCYRNI